MKEMVDVKIGDIVRLKSGSPRLVVTGIDPDPDNRHERDIISVAWIGYGTHVPHETALPRGAFNKDAPR